jgi:hypothetical protein
MAIDVDINQERIDREEKQYNVVLCNVSELSPPTSQSISRTNRNVNDELELVLRLVEDAAETHSVFERYSEWEKYRVAAERDQ